MVLFVSRKGLDVFYTKYRNYMFSHFNVTLFYRTQMPGIKYLEQINKNIFFVNFSCYMSVSLLMSDYRWTHQISETKRLISTQLHMS